MNESHGPLDTPLWQFALAIYMQDGVSAECIELQDRLGANVNLLLFGAYAGAVERAVLSRDALKAASAFVADWHDHITVPLRQARRALKPWSADDGGGVKAEAETLRTSVKAAELESERIELALLWSWLRSQELPRAEPEDALLASIQQVLVHCGSTEVNPKLVVPHLCASALAQAHRALS